MKQLYKLWPGVFLFLLVAGNSHITAQQSTIRGKAVDSGTGKTIEYISILNYSRHTRIYSNSKGEFNLDAQTGDTLVLYAVGYYYQKIIVDRTMLNTLEPKAFTLSQQAFEISEVRIIGLGTYEEFKQQFISLDRPQTKTEKLAESLAQISHQAAREAYDKAKAEQKLNGITFLTVPILTPEEKERIILAEIIEKEKIRDQIYQKFNPVVVKKVTGLTDDDVVIEFMVFCDFSDAYLLKVNEYDLMVSIARKFEMFNSKKQEEKSMQNRLGPGNEDFYPNA
jgi:hypothetical protein